MKNNKDNIQYFTTWEGMRTLGLGMLIVGIGFLWLRPFSFFFSYIFGALLTLAGFAVFLIGNIGRSGEEDIIAEVNRRKEGIEFPEVETERDYQRRVPERPEIFDFEGFVLREGLYLKKMKNGSICSSEYAKARMYPLTDAFLIKCKTFSLVSDEETVEAYEIPFDEVEEIETVSERRTLRSGKKAYSVKICHFVITYDGGKTLALISTDDAAIDELIVRLKKMVKDATAQ